MLQAVLATAVVVGLMASQSEVAAQTATGEAHRERASDFTALHRRWKDSQDIETRIELGLRLLATERQVEPWPLPEPRDRTVGGLQLALGEAFLNRRTGARADNIETAIAHFTEALGLREVDPAGWSRAQNFLGLAHLNRVVGQKADNVEKALQHFQAALTVRTKEAMPRQWASTQHNLGNAYAERVAGTRADNVAKAIAHYTAAAEVTKSGSPEAWADTQRALAILHREEGNTEKAIEHYRAVLTVRTREAFPNDWANAQERLGDLYYGHTKGDRGENLEAAIRHFRAALIVRTRTAAPGAWAALQVSLAHALQDRTHGDRAQNLEDATAACEAALEAVTLQSDPGEWARAHNCAGISYTYRVRGERAANIEKALAHYEATLAVYTREAAPLDWALAQNNLALAFSERLTGNRADNREKAIFHYEAALTVLTMANAPRTWAAARLNLGTAYEERARGDHAENIEKAIGHYQAALAVHTREALPKLWADTQHNLGAAFGSRRSGNRADNLERSIAHYQAALTVFTREAFPYDWAITQNSLGNAYLNREVGTRNDNIRSAAEHFRSALAVRTIDADPRGHLRSARRLGEALAALGRWPDAARTFASARKAFLVQFGQGVVEAEARELIADAGPLFAEAAYAAAEQGNLVQALELADEGRARLLAVALRLQSIELPAAKRARLDELRAAIRTQRQLSETTQGTDRLAAIQKLADLRREMVQLLDEAPSGDGRQGTLAQAQSLVSQGGAVIVPLVTFLGSKLLIVTARSEKPSVVDIPKLTTRHLDQLMLGDGSKVGAKGGWLGAYNINYLPEHEQAERLPEWYAAIGEVGETLWKLFGEPLRAALDRQGVRHHSRLVWLASGALGVLPLGLVQDPASGRRLADDFEIVHAPSIASLTASRPGGPSSAVTLAAIVNPTGDLPGTEQEGLIVASYFPADRRTVVKNAAATPEAVLAGLKGKTYWHVASHGMFCWSDVRQSALIGHGGLRRHCDVEMTGAPLTVQRLQEADGLGRPRLVVLSACETGLFDIRSNPNEFVGLPSAFAAMGAQGVLGTLWPVSDAATALLMAKFYELHLADGLTPPAALAQAQRWLRTSTNKALVSYLKVASARGRLPISHFDELEIALRAEELSRSPRRALVQWMNNRPASTPSSTGVRSPNSSGLALPYSHPFFWAGFVYTGL